MPRLRATSKIRLAADLPPALLLAAASCCFFCGDPAVFLLPAGPVLLASRQTVMP